MMESFVIILSFLCLLAFLAIFWINNSKPGLPPGPKGLPFIGHIHYFDGNAKLYKQITKWHKQYGDIFTVHMGRYPVIILCSPTSIQEAFVTHGSNFSSRPRWMFLIKHYFKSLGISWNEFHWEENRNLALTAMKGLGLGKLSLEERISEEAQNLCIEFKKSAGVIDPQWIIEPAVSNIICSIVFGKRFQYDDRQFLHLFESLSHNVRTNMLFNSLNYIPWALPIYLLFKGSKMMQAMANMNEFKMFIKENIREHLERFNPENICDLIDVLIDKLNRTNVMTDDKTDLICSSVLELFAAGTQSVTMTLLWFLIYMVHYPEVQTKCREEIHQAIGKEKPPSMQDGPSMPFTEATLLEVQRLASVGVMSLPHSSRSDFWLQGYFIPKDAMVLASLYHSHHDPTAWKDPYKFIPQRWISHDGEVIRHHKAFMPFSLGPRKCLGFQLAKMEIFLFAVALLQNIQFSPSETLPSLEGIHGVTMLTEPFTVDVSF